MTPSELRPLAWSRLFFGLVFLVRTTPVLSLFDKALGADALPLLGWPHGGATSAMFGLALPVVVVKGLCIVRTLGALLFTLGVATAPAGVVASIAGYVVFMQDAFGFTFTQHLLFVGVLLLSLADSACVLALRPDPVRSARTSRWLVFSIPTSIYLWAAIVKIRPDWLDGRTLGAFVADGRLRGPLASLLLGTPDRRAVAGPLVVATELALPMLLWAPRTRLLGVGVAAGMHLGIEWMGHPDVIGWAMLALLLSFLPARSEPGAQSGP